MSAGEHSSQVLEVFFDDNERDYRGGEKRALIMTICVCSRFNVKLPAWARKAIVEAYISLPKSWNDVFGRPVVVAKGKNVEAERRRRRIGTRVIGRVRELNSQGEPIGPALFEKVGEEFGVSGSTIKGIYYDEEMVETFKLLNDPDAFYKEFYERLERYKSNISKGKVLKTSKRFGNTPPS
jgi:hypothetical protein